MKIDFLTIESLIEWLSEREAKYELYIETETKNVVAMPTVSTRPIKIGIAPFKENTVKTVEDIKKAIPNLEGRIFTVSQVDYHVAER